MTWTLQKIDVKSQLGPLISKYIKNSCSQRNIQFLSKDVQRKAGSVLYTHSVFNHHKCHDLCLNVQAEVSDRNTYSVNSVTNINIRELF